jgi:hypothetical protein
MRRILVSALLSASAVMASTPAAAAIIIGTCGGGSSCVDTDENVLLTAGTNLTQVNGVTNQTNTQVLITRALETSLLNADASGQASISAVDQILNGLTFNLLGGATFQAVEFNLLNGATSPITVQLTTSAGQSESFTIANPNGANRFGITAAAGEALTGATFTSQGGFDSFRQLRFGGITTTSVGAIPEPATWGMMLIGFGAIGGMMRRKKAAAGKARVRYNFA